MKVSVFSMIAAVAACFLMVSVAAAAPDHPGEGDDPTSCKDCHHEKKKERTYDSVRPWIQSRHAATGVTCTDCHLKKGIEGENLLQAVTSEKKEEAHAHMVENPGARDMKTYFVEVCGACHGEELDEFTASVHGTAHLKNGRGISCIDCHDPHRAPAVSNTVSRLYRGNDLKTCGRCHKDMLESYMQTFHGKQFALGNSLVPTCTYCHSGHERPVDDPESVIYAETVGNLCAGCHGEAMAQGAGVDEMMIHNLSKDSTRKIIHFRDPELFGFFSIASFIDSSYISLIIGVVGFFTLLSTRDFIKKTRSGQVLTWKKAKEEKTVKRFSLSWRIQHLFWAVSFIVLAATGLSLKFPDSIFSEMIVWAVGGGEMRSFIHRLAALVFMGTAVAHLALYLLRRNIPGKIFLTKKDFIDALLHISYLFDRTDKMPLMGRYAWHQKVEYWATVIGAFMVISTGLLMWGFEPLMKTIPLELIHYSQIIHGWEAILAVLAIVSQHFYHTILNPLVFPMDLSWITGKTKYSLMEHDHPLELMEIETEKREKDDTEKS